VMVTGASAPGLSAGGRRRGSCACAAAAQKSKAKTGADWRIGDFTVDKGEGAFFEC